MEVEHVKAHRTKKDKKEMSHFERFVTDGNEKADELAKAGAMLDDGSMAGARAKKVQQEREEVFAALQYAASVHCLVGRMEGLRRAQAEAKRKVGFRDYVQDRPFSLEHRELCMVPLVRDLGLPPASWGSLGVRGRGGERGGVKLRWFGPPLPTRALLLSPCFCVWPFFFRMCEAGRFSFFCTILISV